MNTKNERTHIMAKIRFQTPMGTAKYPHLNTPDTAFDTDNPKYKTELLFDAAEIAPLLEQIKAEAAEKFGKKNVRMPFSTDEETGQVSVKMQSKFQPQFDDSTGNIILPENLPHLGGGSKLRAKGIMNLYEVSGTSGVALMLDRVQIVDVVGGFGSDGFDAVEGGYVADKKVLDAAMHTVVTADLGADSNFDF